MQTLRQAAGGIAIGVISLVLVIGAVALSLAQGRTPVPESPTLATIATPTTAPDNTAAAVSRTSVPATKAATAAPSQAAVTVASTAHTTIAPTRPPATSAVTCGPYAGWVRAYEVQPGDTQYRIATMHGITVTMLQRANCKSGTLIYAGELLWVPFALPPPTELTIIPTFPTPTDPATPTETSTATATDTPTQPT